MTAKNQIYFYDFRQAALGIFLHLAVTDGGMKSCRLRAISCEVTQKLKRATTLE
jgi:hypothetical protein